MKQLTAILLLLSLAGSAAAQTKVLAIEGQPKSDVEKSFGAEWNVDNGTKAADNLTKLQSQIDAGNTKYPLFFPGGNNSLRGFTTSATTVLPTQSGIELDGVGFAHGAGATGLTAKGSFWRLKAVTHATTFDGTTNKLTSAGPLTITAATNATPIECTSTAHGLVTGMVVTISGATGNTNANGSHYITVLSPDTFTLHHPLTGAGRSGNGAFEGTCTCLTGKMIVTGRAVVATDAYNSILVTDGTGVTKGWYGIHTAVPGPSGTGYWLLDRPWSDGAITDGEGRYCPETVQNHGFGTVHRGIQWSARAQLGGIESSSFGNICYHVVSEKISGTSSGKHRFYDCSFAYYKIGVLCGTYASGYGTDDFPAATNLTTHDDGHADSCRFYNCAWKDNDDCFVATNDQAMDFAFYSPRAGGVRRSFLNFQAGGRAVVTGLHMDGGTGTQCALRIGRDIAFNNGTIDFYSTFTDANNCRNPQLIDSSELEDVDRRIGANFIGGFITRDLEDESLSMVDVASQTFVVVDGVQAADVVTGPVVAPGWWSGSLRARSGATAPYRSTVIFTNNPVNSTVEEVTDLITADSEAGATFYFSGNYYPGRGASHASGETHLFLREGWYRVTGSGTGEWLDEETGYWPSQAPP